MRSMEYNHWSCLTLWRTLRKMYKLMPSQGSRHAQFPFRAVRQSFDHYIKLMHPIDYIAEFKMAQEWVKKIGAIQNDLFHLENGIESFVSVDNALIVELSRFDFWFLPFWQLQDNSQFNVYLVELSYATVHCASDLSGPALFYCKENHVGNENRYSTLMIWHSTCNILPVSYRVVVIVVHVSCI